LYLLACKRCAASGSWSHSSRDVHVMSAGRCAVSEELSSLPHRRGGGGGGRLFGSVCRVHPRPAQVAAPLGAGSRPDLPVVVASSDRSHKNTGSEGKQPRRCDVRVSTAPRIRWGATVPATSSCSAPQRRVIYPQRLSGESYLAGLIKLFSQMTREVVRSPGPGIRARSTAFFAFNLSSTRCQTPPTPKATRPHTPPPPYHPGRAG
jgi:hypothetical protein